MRESLRRLFDNRKFYLVLSILLAVLYWLVLSLGDDSDIEWTVYDVPVQMEYNASFYQSFGLEIIDRPDMTVDLTVSGPRDVVTELTPDDFLVYPNVNSVTTGGTRTLRLVHSTVNNNAKYTILRISQESVTLRFDRMVAQKYTVQLDNTGLSVQDGYLLSSCVLTPTELTVSGPSEEVSEVSQVRVTLPDISGGQGLRESMMTRGEIHLLNTEGEEVDDTLLTLDFDQVEVNISVLRRIEQQLKLQFTNVPRGFDTATLSPVLDRESVSIAVPTTYDATVEEENYPVYINFFDLQSKSEFSGSYTAPLTSGEDYTLLDNVQQVTVQFNTEGYAEYRVQVSDLRVVNVPEGKTVTPMIDTLDGVILYGPASAIEQLQDLADEGVLDEYVVAQIDASKVNIQSGQEMLPVQILVPSINSVFAIGSYVAGVSVE